MAFLFFPESLLVLLGVNSHWAPQRVDSPVMGPLWCALALELLICTLFFLLLPLDPGWGRHSPACGNRAGAQYRAQLMLPHLYGIPPPGATSPAPCPGY